MPQSELAVLTGDLIRSRRQSASVLDAAMQALAAGAEAMAAWPDGRPARFTRFRGDGWQCLAPAPASALRAALFLRACLRAADRDLDTRISVGIGPGSLPAGGDLAAAGGTAFELSGRGLDGMAKVQQFSLAWAVPPPCATLTSAVVALADEVSRFWTARQAAAMMDTLAPGSIPQQRIAERHGVSQQAIAKRLGGSGDWALQRALVAVEAAA
jgi:hypothetical protein